MRGYYFFAAPGQPSYEKWHYFGSRNWHKGDGTDWPEFGELETTRQTWRDGSFPCPQPPAVQIGSDVCIGGWLEPQAVVETPPTKLIAGIDSRCYFDFNVNCIRGSGGTKKNGAADTSHLATIVGSGGGKLDKGARFGPGGGGLLDGSADFSLSTSIVGSGGGRLDGSALDTHNATIVGAGGGRLDGAADVGFTASIVALGGGRLDGAALENIAATIVGSGGGRLDGAATTISKPHILGRGGAKLDGHAIMSHTPGFLGSGGGKKNGRAKFPTFLNTTNIADDGLCTLGLAHENALALHPDATFTNGGPNTSTTFALVAFWDLLWNSGAGTMTAVLNVTSFTGGVNHQWRFRVSIRNNLCNVIYNGPYSSTQIGAFQVTITDTAWPGTFANNNRITMQLEVRSDSGSVSWQTTNNGSCNLTLPG